MMKWPTVTVETAEGPQTAIAPYIISASRSTDIPAFHADWFKTRLDAGYCKWRNPFNHRSVYVSFERARAFVFWTKNAAPFLTLLPELDRRGLAYYFQFTLNDYEAEVLEPHVPPLAERLATFMQLSQMLGSHRVIWRHDPLVLTDALTVDSLLAKIERIGGQLHPHTEKLVFSFADITGYAKVRKNLQEAGVPFREFDESAMHTFAAGLAPMLADWRIAGCTCAETIDLASYKISHNRCIDGQLLLRVSGNDPELLHAFGIECPIVAGEPFDQSPLKDKGQRKQCGCIASKDIGQYDTCSYLCRYCYANASPQAVQDNLTHITPQAESIVAE